MEELHAWLGRQFDERSRGAQLGAGRGHHLHARHWERLTLFLRVAGAPLDNNICERALKKAILHRKNALFYKTHHGAQVGDIFMSLIHTVELCEANPFDYLTELERHAEDVARESAGLDAVELPRNAGRNETWPNAVRRKPFKKTDVAQRLRKALAKRTKVELIDILVELANDDRSLLRRLRQIRVGCPARRAAAATRQAIADATDFDERDINRNFDYDYEAYEEVKRNLGRLIELGELRLAMELSLELMKHREATGRNERRRIDDAVTSRSVSQWSSSP